MRGKRLLTSSMRRLAGLIPAHAGKTTKRQTLATLPRAHPRACGENRACRLRDDHHSGSSPRMRGKHLRVHRRDQRHGLIPAHAGKTFSRERAVWLRAAHPRACGENEDLYRIFAIVSGSSPRMRGKRIRDSRIGDRPRLIPAHAGKTSTSRPRRSGCPAHPRACGENVASSSVARVSGGSSPRMRGKRSSRLQRESRVGLIPAHAGKTTHRVIITQVTQAHPRACGENVWGVGVGWWASGSSPRMRGKHGNTVPLVHQ